MSAPPGWSWTYRLCGASSLRSGQAWDTTRSIGPTGRRESGSHAEQAFRIRRDTGPTAGPWEAKEIAYGITSLPASLAGPRHLAIYVRRHWAIENKEHYVRDVTFREDAKRASTGNQSNAHAAIRNLVTGAFRKKGHANIAAARRRTIAAAAAIRCFRQRIGQSYLA